MGELILGDTEKDVCVMEILPSGRLLVEEQKQNKERKINMIEKLYYTADEIAQMVGVGRTTSYKMVNQMNAELLKQGFLVVKGKIPKEYFDARYYGGSHPVEVGA